MHKTETPRPNPTQQTYKILANAYSFFNERLFDGKLPECLITLQRQANTLGYFAPTRFGSADPSEKIDEIALNPSHFDLRSDKETFSTLVHEMVHLQQHHFGTPTRGGYHNQEWAAMMIAVGLIPSHTGKPGGKQVGPKMSDYIEAGGRFDMACDALLETRLGKLYVELWNRHGGKNKKNSATRTKYKCRYCAVQVWGKPGLNIVCGECLWALLPSGHPDHA